jgi:hypothetical protein
MEFQSLYVTDFSLYLFCKRAFLLKKKYGAKAEFNIKQKKGISMHSFVEKSDSIYKKVCKKISITNTKSDIIDIFYESFNSYIENFRKILEEEYENEELLLEMNYKLDSLVKNEINFMTNLIYQIIKTKKNTNFPQIVNEKSVFLKE